MKLFWALLLVLVACAADAQVPVVRTLADLLSRAVSTNSTARTQAAVDVSRFDESVSWRSSKRWEWNPTNSLSTNLVVNRRIFRASTFLPPGSVGRWEHEWDGDVGVLGASGNGVSDDTFALTNAVQVAKSAGMQLYMPAGTYRVLATLDCRNSDDNAMEFAGIRGDGLTLTRIVAEHNDPIITLRGRGGEYSNFRLGYAALNTNTTAKAIVGYGFVYYLALRNIEVINAYIGMYSDPTTSSSTFSCSIDNLAIRSCAFANGDIQTSSGSDLRNIYLSNPGSSAVDFLWRDRAGGGFYSFITLEHSNFRDCALRILGEGASIGKLRFEGLRPVTDANWIDAGGNGLTIASLATPNNFSAGHLLSGITSNGVATIEKLGQAVTGGHGFRVGDTVTIGGALPSGYSGSFTITAVTETNFTYTPTGAPGANATTNYAAGQDCIWAYVGSFPAPALAATETYGNGKIHIKHWETRNNKILGNTPTIRQGWSWPVAREFGGKRLDISVDSITQGSQFRNGDQVQGFIPIIASSVSSGVATVYLKYPHEVEQGKYVSISGGINLDYGQNYTQVTGVPDRYTITVATGAGDVGLTVESGNFIPVKARIVQRSRTNDKALLVTDVAHSMTVGARVLVRSNSVASYNKAEALVDSVPSTTSFTYLSPGTDEATATETNGIIAEFSSGLNASLQTSSSVGLRKFGDFFDPRIAVPTHVLAANSSTSMVFTVNGVRPNATVTVTPFNFHALTPGTRYTAGVSTNDVVLLVSENLTGSDVTNNVNILKLHIQ